MKIAIKFGDNDFQSTFNPLMETLHEAFKYNDGLPNDKQELLIIINSLSYGFYRAFQNQFKYGDDSIKNYLILDERKLLIGEEVDLYLKRLEPYGGMDNSSTFILDTSLYNNNVYTV